MAIVILASIFVAGLLVYCWRSASKEAERIEKEDQEMRQKLKQAADPVERYYIERENAIERQKRETSSWKSPSCPSCRIDNAMMSIDDHPGIYIPEETKWIELRPGKENSPKARAKYLCRICMRKW